MNDRLKIVIEYIKSQGKYRTQKSIASKIDVDYTNLSSAISGRQQYLTRGLAEKFNTAFPELNVDWILKGEGDMLKEKQENSNVAINNTLLKVKNSNVNVPYYDVDFAGGWDSDEMFSNQLPAFNITSPDFVNAEFACNLVGNSISNRVPNGAVIGLREIFGWQTYFPTNELYGVLTKNDLRTVKIVKRSKKNGYLTLVPDPLAKFNQTGYEPEEIPIEFVSKFFQVVAWAKFEKVAM